MTTISVVEQLRVSPPQGSAADASIPLTFLDVPWIFMGPVHRLFLYSFPHSTAHFVDSVLPNLKSSLSLALRDFYPLAGNLIRSDPVFEIRYVDGDSVSLTVAEYNDDKDDGSDDPNLFQKLYGSDPCDFPKFQQLIPQLPPPTDVETPLLALQVTVFPNQGISLGVTVHHAACDGSSSVHFLKTWASACISVGSHISDPLPLLPPPLMDRSLIADPLDLYSLFMNRMREIRHGKLVNESSDEVLATFTLGGDHIRCLREFVTYKARIPHCSTFVLACSFVWACLVKTRRLETHRMAAFVFSADYRSRLSPPVPSTYFGNCLCFASAEANVGDLIGGDGLVAASEAMGRAIEGLKGIQWDGGDERFKKFGSFKPGEVLSVAGSPKFGVYGIDFGWGRPWKVVVPSIQKTGAISLAESRDGGGGVEIGLVLQRQEMDEFTARFSEDLNSVKEDHRTSV